MLDEVRVIIIDHPSSADDKGVGDSVKKELVEALFAEILERVGDREKEYTLRWWYDNREGLMRRRVGEAGNSQGENTHRMEKNYHTSAGVTPHL